MYEKSVPIPGIDPIAQSNRANLLFHRGVILRLFMPALFDDSSEWSETQSTAGPIRGLRKGEIGICLCVTLLR